MPSEMEASSVGLTKQQETRAKLREGFLKAVQDLNGEPCNILTYEQSQLQATFGSWHPDGTEILVRDLKTPAHDNLPSAVLRIPDVIAVQFDTLLQLT